MGGSQLVPKSSRLKVNLLKLVRVLIGVRVSARVMIRARVRVKVRVMFRVRLALATSWQGTVNLLNDEKRKTVTT